VLLFSEEAPVKGQATMSIWPKKVAVWFEEDVV